MAETKTIKVSVQTHERLMAVGEKGETYEGVIRGLLDRDIVAASRAAALRDPGFNKKSIVRHELLSKLRYPEGAVCFIPNDVYAPIADTHYRGLQVISEVGEDEVVVADFNGEADPYKTFKAFWKAAPKAPEMALFFTDGRRTAIMSSGMLIRPTGSRKQIDDLTERGRLFANYYPLVLKDWIEKAVEPYIVIDKRVQYAGGMCYWGVYIAKYCEDAGSDVQVDGDSDE